MKKPKNIGFLILPLIALEWDINSNFQITFGWWWKTITFTFHNHTDYKNKEYEKRI